MLCFDLFNGDADGICAMHQLRMAEPREARLITGVKRDLELLRQLPCDAALDVTVMDLCFDRNVAEVRRVLLTGGRVRYFDHHAAGTMFQHPALQAHVDTSADLCTSLIVDRHLGGRFRDWAIVGAYGDSLASVASALARAAGHEDGVAAKLQRLGVLLNYNAYGETIEDLHLHPLRLYESLHQFEDPMDFMDGASGYARLVDGYEHDRARSGELCPHSQRGSSAVYMLPGEPWARRLCGTLANDLARRAPSGSVAVLTRRSDGSWLVSARPLRLPEGGGRIVSPLPGREWPAHCGGR